MSANSIQSIDQYVENHNQYQNFASNHFVVGAIITTMIVMVGAIVYKGLQSSHVNLGLNEYGVIAITVGSGALLTAIALSALGIHYRRNIDMVKEQAHQKYLINTLADKKEADLFDETSTWDGINLKTMLSEYTPSQWKDLFGALESATLSEDQRKNVIHLLLKVDPTNFILNFRAIKSHPSYRAKFKDETIAMIHPLIDQAIANLSINQVIHILIELNRSYAQSTATLKEKGISTTLVNKLKENNPVNYLIAYTELKEEEKLDPNFILYHETYIGTISLRKKQRKQLIKAIDKRYYQTEYQLKQETRLALLKRLIRRGECVKEFLNEVEKIGKRYKFGQQFNNMINLTRGDAHKQNLLI